MSKIFRRHWPGNPARPGLALHCMLASSSYWGPIHAQLAGDLDLRSFDMPGHGKSEGWTPAQGDPDFHTAVTRIAASFIDRPLDLIGHSLGATVALRIAVAAPEAIRSLTLIEPVLFASAPKPDLGRQDADLASLIADGQIEEATRRFVAVWGAQPYDQLPPAMQAQMQQRIALVAACGPTLENDTAGILRDGRLEAITAPVLLISGEESPPVIHDITDALAERLPDVGRARVPGAGHMAPITHPREVAGLIRVNLDRS